MAVIAGLRSAGASDPGRKREKNEDRYHADPDRGIFFVVDGVGGQAAGEKAADTACSILKARLERQTGSPADRIREAVALANNEIWRLARENNEWHGMACVLTVAVLEGETVHIGQVGDSRLYLLTPGEIRKLTHDHSPVGEREDRGEIDEVTAMRHPRRNEVYRDVGTTEHSPDDPDFVEVTSAQYPVNGALLLCSDGLSDLVTSAEIRQIVVENAGDPAAAARALIRAANDAGGKDNITVVVAEGPNFASEVRRQAVAPRRMLPPAPPASRHPALSAPAFLLYGLALALGLVFFFKPHWVSSPAGQKLQWGHVTEANIWRVSGEINTAIQNARPGDTVLVAPGTYNEQIRLRDGISVVSERPRGATLRASAVAVTGDDLRSARLQGFRIQPDDNMYLQTGIQLTGSRAEIVDNEITGTVTAGIELQNSPETLLLANTVIARSRAAVVIGGDGQGPRLSGNYLAAQSDPAIRVTGPARPSITGNTIRAADPLFLPPGQKPEELLRSNIVLSPEGKDKAPTRGNAPARVR